MSDNTQKFGISRDVSNFWIVIRLYLNVYIRGRLPEMSKGIKLFAITKPFSAFIIMVILIMMIPVTVLGANLSVTPAFHMM